ncbi:MAG TPA: hypothetical protein PJ982_13620 [Lacipirellulaceae bacterium]|nr:hypothetical protein [Lacipirellulaceae bacterium]
MSVADALGTLRQAEDLYGHRIGFMAVPTIEGAAWRCLFVSPLAEFYFQGLLHSSARAGQAYALIGLRALRSPRFAPEATRFVRDTVSLRVVRGMRVERYAFRQVVAEVDRGGWNDEFLREPIPYAPGSWALDGVVFDW